jgi:hypothetical protein
LPRWRVFDSRSFVRWTLSSSCARRLMGYFG